MPGSRCGSRRYVYYVAVSIDGYIAGPGGEYDFYPRGDPGVELVREPLGIVRKLKAEEGDKDIWLCGGGKLAATLLPEIDELIVRSYPVVAGAGTSAFSGDFRPTLFTPAERQSFGNGTQVTWYTRAD